MILKDIGFGEIRSPIPQNFPAFGFPTMFDRNHITLYQHATVPAYFQKNRPRGGMAFQTSEDMLW